MAKRAVRRHHSVGRLISLDGVVVEDMLMMMLQSRCGLWFGCLVMRVGEFL